MSSAYKSFSVISRVTLWTEFVPSLYVLKKRPYMSPLSPENFGYKSRLGLIVSVFTVKKRSNRLQLTVTIAPGEGMLWAIARRNSRAGSQPRQSG